MGCSPCFSRKVHDNYKKKLYNKNSKSSREFEKQNRVTGKQICFKTYSSHARLINRPQKLSQRQFIKREKVKKNAQQVEQKNFLESQPNKEKQQKFKPTKKRQKQQQLKCSKQKPKQSKQKQLKGKQQKWREQKQQNYKRQKNISQTHHYIDSKQSSKKQLNSLKNESYVANSQYVRRIHNQRQALIKEKAQKCNKGIYNIGNSCYLNSALQCFYQTKYLNQQLNNKYGSFADHIQGQFTTSYKNMCHRLLTQKKPFDPTKIKRVIQKNNERFVGNRQHDSGQVVNTILNIFQQETNKVQKVKPITIIYSYQKTDESLYRQYARKHRAITHSIIDFTFTGSYKTVYKCCICRQQKRLFEKFSIVYLPLITRRNKKISRFSDCILEFYQDEPLDWDCLQCKKQTPHRKAMQIYKANKTIVFCLKRFNQNNSKIKDQLSIPDNLNLNHYNKVGHQVSESGRQHRLYAAIIHLGQYNSGHYIAYCYDQNAQCWASYNDSSVCFIEANQVKEKIKKAYLLFYRLQTLEEYEQQMKNG